MSAFTKNPNAIALTSTGWSIAGTPQISGSAEFMVGSGSGAGLTDIEPHPVALANGNVVYAWRTFDVSDFLFVKVMHEGLAVNQAVQLGDDPTYGTTPQVVGFADSSFAVIWQETDPGTNGANIKMQRFLSNGQPDGTVSNVNTSLPGLQSVPTVTELVGGGFVVAWTSTVNGSTDLVMRKFDANGVGGAEMTMQNAGTEVSPNITALANGGWVMAWVQNGGATGWDGKAQIFNADGTAHGGTFDLQSDLAKDQVRPDLIGLENGGFVALWQSQQPDNSFLMSWRIYDANGNSAMQPVQIPIEATWAKAAALPNGCFIFVWSSPTGAGDNDGGVYMQAYAPDGSLIGTPVLVNQTTAGFQGYGDISVLPDGGWVISWEGNGPGDDYGIHSRTFHFEDVAPVGQNTAFTVGAGGQHTFSLNDFPYFDLGSDGLESVRIVTLPASGQLTLNGKAVVAGDVIAAQDLGNLKYTASGQQGTASFTFVLRDQGLDGSNTDATARTMSITVGAANDPPVLSGAQA